MLLAIDVGNSHTVIGVYDNARLHNHWRITSSPAATTDELASRLHGLLALTGMSFSKISGMVIGSVVPQLTLCWQQLAADALEAELESPPLVVDHRLKFPITIALPNPAEVGADRLVNASAAYSRHQRALIIVDFGTAITLDCVSADGAYLGGTISPGMAIAMEALGQRTAKLPRVAMNQSPDSPIGTSTVEAIRSGVLYGYAGMIEGLVGRIKARMAPEEPLVIATGGMAGLIAPHTGVIEELDPWLTLEGLRLVYESNRQTTG